MAATLEEDFALLKDAIMMAGGIALKHHSRQDYKTWMKRGVEPVTEIDLQIDKSLKERLGGARPGYGWLSEETADDKERLFKEKIWIVDPIDGTRGFIRGQNDFSITGALVENGYPVIGIIFAPARKEFFSALKGKGATLNDSPISVTKTTVIEGMRVQGDRDYLKSKKWMKAWPNMVISKHQSFALRIASVAVGKYDAAISARYKSEWDVVAGDLILSEAGGLCIDGEGNRFAYNQDITRLQQIIATTPAIKDEILAQLKLRMS